MLTHDCAHAKELSLFIKGTTDAGGSVKVPKTTHRVVPLFDTAMILFNSVVEVGIAAMRDVFAEYFADGARIGVMSVSGHPLWHMLGDFQRSIEKAFGCVHISMLTEHGISQIAIAIDGTVEVFLDASDFDVRFIHVPGATSLSLAFGSEFVGKQGSEAGFPLANCLMCEFKARSKNISARSRRLSL